MCGTHWYGFHGLAMVCRPRIRCLNASPKEVFYAAKDQSCMVNRIDLYAEEGARHLQYVVSLATLKQRLS